MSMIKKIGASRVAIATMAAVLAASGAAFAAGGGPGGEGQGGRPPGGPGGGPGGAAAKYLTYSETHTYKRCAEKVLRTDAGTITSVSSTSVTVHERDGNDVTRALDGDTDVRIRGNEDATTDDLAVGDKVVVSGEKGEPADVVGVQKKAS